MTTEIDILLHKAIHSHIKSKDKNFNKHYYLYRFKHTQKMLAQYSYIWRINIYIYIWKKLETLLYLRNEAWVVDYLKDLISFKYV